MTDDVNAMDNRFFSDVMNTHAPSSPLHDEPGPYWTGYQEAAIVAATIVRARTAVSSRLRIAAEAYGYADTVKDRQATFRELCDALDAYDAVFGVEVTP